MADLDDKIPGWSTREMWKYSEEWSFDGNPALVINHMQMGIAGNGKFSGAPHSQELEAMKELNTIEMQKKLIAAFRERNLPIVFISVVPNPIGYLPKWGYIFKMTGLVGPKGHLNNQELAECCEVIPELGRLPEERILYHTGTCPMTGSHLDEYLRQFGVRDIVLTGWTAQSTLYNSLVQLTNAWYSVVVPKDATGGPLPSRDITELVLKKMMRMWGLVTTVDDVIAHLPNNK